MGAAGFLSFLRRSHAVAQRARLSRLRIPLCVARLAQLVERKALNLVVVGSSPTVGVLKSFPTAIFIPHKDVVAGSSPARGEV